MANLDNPNTMSYVYEGPKMSFTETQEAFIFNTIYGYIDSMCVTTIPKDVLVKAVQLVKLMESSTEYGINYDINAALSNASQTLIISKRAYNKGFEEGRKSAYKDINAYFQQNIQE